MLELIPCPEPDCPAPAEIVRRWTFPPAHGLVEYLQTRCSEGHVRTPVTETVAVGESVAARESVAVTERFRVA